MLQVGECGGGVTVVVRMLEGGLTHLYVTGRGVWRERDGGGEDVGGRAHTCNRSVGRAKDLEGGDTRIKHQHQICSLRKSLFKMIQITNCLLFKWLV